ncbi:hypothetical protein AA309_18420 [Microvirga vignae]|uniref:Anti-sigma factor NepR domain-containing protein n=1 Tax=Microvirga vignae TaxID=1225564 RepID=A0A0H1RGH6_9HYPH|nr:NepR family anti-sigma factor [Microvirga vignae]KLK91732.1 hypothetical protein AA309_18420 [Microvirga vignae]
MTDSISLRPAYRTLPSLTFSQAEVNFILGHSLRSLYEDLLNMPVPAHLEMLLVQLEKRDRDQKLGG